jgi:hypothetical protein
MTPSTKRKKVNLVKFSAIVLKFSDLDEFALARRARVADGNTFVWASSRNLEFKYLAPSAPQFHHKGLSYSLKAPSHVS